jgi:APA family basic amino acid/polyamine antiporter
MPELRPVLGTWSTTALVVGGMVGSGIFLLPPLVAREVPDAWGVLLVWAAGGAVALCGALTMSELGAMMPRAGGQYVFLREAWGRAPAFLFGWMTFAVNYTGTIAAVAAAFALYVALFAPIGGFAVKLVAIALIWLLTAVNLLGTRRAAWMQGASTVAKVAALAGLVLLAFLLPTPARAASVPSAGSVTLAGVGVALGAVLFAYDGFAGATFLAGEMKDPRRTLPRATVLGVLIVVLVYVAAVGAYLHVLGVGGVAASARLVSDVAGAVLGDRGAILFGAAVLASTFGLVSAYVLQSPRIYYAMARDGATYEGFGGLNRAGVPAFGLVMQAEWASLLVLWGTFDQLVGFVIVSSWTFNALTGLALWRLRRARPDAERPYRAPLLAAIAFTLASAFVVVVQFVAAPTDALLGMALTLSGVPVYAFLRWRRAGRGSGPNAPS